METISQTEAAYDFYIETLAQRTGRTAREIQNEISQIDFLAEVHDLHHRYMNGEFSIGRLADLLGINAFQLDYLLTTLNMALHNN